jgi:hypothetical protein
VRHYGLASGHHRYEIVRLVYTHIDGGSSEYQHVINHEFGHVWGLCDPDPAQCSLGSWPVCSTASVMHQYYGCSTNVLRPQVDDKNNVTAQMDTYP